MHLRRFRLDGAGGFADWASDGTHSGRQQTAGFTNHDHIRIDAHAHAISHTPTTVADFRSDEAGPNSNGGPNR